MVSIIRRSSSSRRNMMLFAVLFCGILGALITILVSSQISTSQEWERQFQLLFNMEGSRLQEGHVRRSTSAEPTTTEHSLIELPPRTKSVVLNIGSSITPILPKISAGPCARTIALEPISFANVPPHPQVLVVPAAVSDRAYLASMNVYNKDGVSSSLAKPSYRARWNSQQQTDVRLVPVLRLVDVLAAISPHIDYILTDAQGYDFQIVRAAVDVLRQRGVPHLRTEVYLDSVTTYQGVHNDLCRDWLPMMNNDYTLLRVDDDNGRVLAGYENLQQARATCQAKLSTPITAGLREANAIWQLASLKAPPQDASDVTLTAFSQVEGPNLPRRFSEQEYGSCFEEETKQ